MKCLFGKFSVYQGGNGKHKGVVEETNVNDHNILTKRKMLNVRSRNPLFR